jgi:alkylated DNA repair dioxygenase AlkB
MNQSHSIESFTPLLDQCISSGFFSNNPSLHPDQVLVNEYRNSVGIRSHFEDEQAFGAVIVTISLNDPIWITLKKPVHRLNSCPSIIEYTRILLKPRSCLIMAKDARYLYRHGITKAKYITTSIDPEVVKLNRGPNYRRISLTIRKLGDGRKRVEESKDLNERGWVDSDPMQGRKCDC